jgi:hypothetical protein
MAMKTRENPAVNARALAKTTRRGVVVVSSAKELPVRKAR